MQSKGGGSDSLNSIRAKAKKYADADNEEIIPKDFNEENIREEMGEEFSVDPELRDEIKISDSPLSSFGFEVYEVEVADKTYVVVEDEDVAEELAIKVVEQDLEEKPDIFNQDWLVSHLGLYVLNFGTEEAAKLVKDNALIDVSGVAEDAVQLDGWQHFLSRYDGNSSETENGFVYWRAQ